MITGSPIPPSNAVTPPSNAVTPSSLPPWYAFRGITDPSLLVYEGEYLIHLKDNQGGAWRIATWERESKRRNERFEWESGDDYDYVYFEDCDYVLDLPQVPVKIEN